MRASVSAVALSRLRVSWQPYITRESSSTYLASCLSIYLSVCLYVFAWSVSSTRAANESVAEGATLTSTRRCECSIAQRTSDAWYPMTVCALPVLKIHVYVVQRT